MGYIFTHHVSQMGTRDCFVDVFESNPECHIPMAQECNRSAEHRRWGMIPSREDKLAVVGTASLQ